MAATTSSSSTRRESARETFTPSSWRWQMKRSNPWPLLKLHIFLCWSGTCRTLGQSTELFVQMLWESEKKGIVLFLRPLFKMSSEDFWGRPAIFNHNCDGKSDRTNLNEGVSLKWGKLYIYNYKASHKQNYGLLMYIHVYYEQGQISRWKVLLETSHSIRNIHCLNTETPEDWTLCKMYN